MSTTDSLLNALKRLMRNKGITYKQAASVLDLSEVSVKRLFSERSFSLLRIEKLCDLAGTDLAELIQLAEASQKHADQLSLQQEQQLVEDTSLLLVAVCIINHLSFDDILRKYDINEPALIRIFVKLDRMKIIDLLPGNRYRLKLSRRFSLQPNGPIQSFFIKNMLKDFFSSHAKQEHVPFQLAWGMLSKESVQELHKKIQRLIDEYLQIAEHDKGIPVQEKMTSSLFIMFHEDMEPDLFKQQWIKTDIDPG
jgi:transcriptional regulator with XRE-family HTH domain